MSFSNIIKRYFSNIFISIVPENDTYRIFSKVLKNGKLKEKFDKVFEVSVSDEKLHEDIEEYLISLQEKYNFAYISLYLDSMGQGAISGVDAGDFAKYSVDITHVHIVKFKTWSAYASYIDINWIKKVYSNVGLDFIYSPFVLLYFLLKENKLCEYPTLYMLNLKDTFALAVFKEERLLFSAFFKLNNEELIDAESVEDWENEEEEKGVEDLVSLDGSSEEEDLSDIEELNELEELEELDDNIEDEIAGDDESDNEYDDNSSVEEIELFGRDLQIYKYLKAFLKEYYTNPLYESDFINDIIVYDSYEMSAEIINSIENDLLLDIQMHKVDVAEKLCDLTIKEVYGGL